MQIGWARCTGARIVHRPIVPARISSQVTNSRISFGTLSQVQSGVRSAEQTFFCLECTYDVSCHVVAETEDVCRQGMIASLSPRSETFCVHCEPNAKKSRVSLRTGLPISITATTPTTMPTKTTPSTTGRCGQVIAGQSSIGELSELSGLGDSTSQLSLGCHAVLRTEHLRLRRRPSRRCHSFKT